MSVQTWDAALREAIKETVKVITERDEARNIARRMYRERNTAIADRDHYRHMLDNAELDLVDIGNSWDRDAAELRAENKRLRMSFMALGGDVPMVYAGIGNSAPAWCAHCGGDMQVVRPGKVQCPECEK